ncbi:transporter substrate-binding domain-containing protein [Hahella sp. HN01]|uniref:transporter substrate-binding domain-containing protein n=1 Tax=Hahella sp. HN01 TaxID=2847262 RepID=UPI001C1EEFCD|nr:transporter substrate-binding domain-containing protein [Hahella sp. HN01]MBU6955255.1 transporter substrate-binding domain-containing protein [Hahella sp. HN01]
MLHFKSLISLVIPLFSLFTFSLAPQARGEIIVKHYQHQDRYKYGLKVLDLALSKLNVPYKIQFPEFLDVSINEARGELMVTKGVLNLEFMSTNLEREEKMIPIRIPIYRGILGLRLLLVTQEKSEIFSKIDDIDDLRQFVGGHGVHWGDLPVYSANGLKVATSSQYETLFTLLRNNRFDYFHRGFLEIWDELDRNQDRLVVADNIMLFYPHPVYFFISRNEPELARKLEEGLNIAIADGSFKTLFTEEMKGYLAKGNLSSRKLIILKNPVVPENSPAIDTSWWLPEKFQKQLAASQ